MPAGEPQHRVVLRGGHHVAIGADQVVVEAHQLRGDVVGIQLAPQLGAEARDEVHAAGGGARLAQVRHGTHQLARVPARAQVELEVGVRRRSQGEDPALRRAHAIDHVRSSGRSQLDRRREHQSHAEAVQVRPRSEHEDRRRTARP